MTEVIPPYNYEKALQELLDGVREYYPNFDSVTAGYIQKAFWYGKEAHEGQKRFSGEDYYIHPIAATMILLSIRPDVDTIVACLLHDVIEDTPVTAEEIEDEFGYNIRFLCEGVEKVAKVSYQHDDRGRKLETLKKLFLAVAKDIRVIFIKLADRIHNLSTLEYVRPEKKQRIALESLNIYAPVAERLSLYDFKHRIEDLCFMHLNPKMYDQIDNQIKKLTPRQKEFIARGRAEMLKIFRKRRIKVLEITGRQKNLASVYNKMKRKNLSSVEEVYDIIGFRVIVATKQSCYSALGALHSNWVPMPGRFKDYISVPKLNGYQSLHTTVLGIGKSKLPTEIQIRTSKMHMDAEFGPAAHWAYKKTRHSNFDSDYLKKVEWFPKSISSKDTTSSADSFFQEISQSILTDRIYVFTPRGDVKTLPAGSTPIDFAYQIHTDVGDTCIGAKVNGVIKPLDYQLQKGQIVEIITRKGRTPNPEWLKFAHSPSARSNISAFLNKQRKIRQAEKAGIELEELEKQIRATNDVKKLPKRPPKKGTNPQRPVNFTDSRKPLLVIGGAIGMPHRVQGCCSPTPNKEIIAYKSRGLDFTLHELNCDTLESLDPERFIEAYFLQEYKLSIRAIDRIGLARDYTRVIAEHGVNIKTFHAGYLDENSRRRVINTFTVEGRSDQEIQDLMRDLRKIPNILEVKISDE